MTKQESSLALPNTVDEITSEWLTAALGERFPGIEVVDTEIVEIIWGSATKVRIKTTYAEDPGPDGPPRELCVKGGYDERLWALGSVGRVYQLEAMFYRDIAPNFSGPLPGWWYAAAMSEPKQNGVVVLDDLVAKGARFGNRREPWDPELVAMALDDQAMWHAGTWDRSGVDADWVTLGSEPNRGSYFERIFADDYWREFLATPVGQMVPAEMQDNHRMVRAVLRSWEIADALPLSLSHGTPHIGNTYIDANGRPHFLDWQCIGWAPGLDDVNHFLVGALTVEDRRAHEKDLVRGYLDATVKYGAPERPFDEAWDEYRVHTIHGFLVPPAASIMQTEDARSAITPRYISAIEDHETLALLGV